MFAIFLFFVAMLSGSYSLYISHRTVNQGIAVIALAVGVLLLGMGCYLMFMLVMSTVVSL